MIAELEFVTIPKEAVPTLEEIRERSLRIQSGWSRRENAKRAGGLVSPKWEAPRVELFGVDDDKSTAGASE